MKTDKIWISGKFEGDRITQEMVLPIHFKLKSYVLQKTYFNNSWMLHQMNQQNKYTPPKPAGF